MGGLAAASSQAPRENGVKATRFGGDCQIASAWPYRAMSYRAVYASTGRTASSAMPSPRLLVIEGNSPQTMAEHVAVGGTPAQPGLFQSAARTAAGRDRRHLLIRPTRLRTLPEGEALEGYDGIAITGSVAAHLQRRRRGDAADRSGARRARDRHAGVRLVLGPAGDHRGGRRQRAQKSEGPRDRLRPRHPADRSRPQASDVCRQARRVQRADRASRRGRDAARRARPCSPPMRCRDVQSVEIRTNGSVAWAVQYHPGISAARDGGDRAPHRHAADRAKASSPTTPT